ncbi:MAG TPA: hypothetical protein DCP69_11895 [Candidatus Omnitrophica bacterium]|nr:hypothetical protein [Candidatus Omnitrophota bacterium]
MKWWGWIGIGWVLVPAIVGFWTPAHSFLAAYSAAVFVILFISVPIGLIVSACDDRWRDKP